MDSYLLAFITESNAIEEIRRSPTTLEIAAHEDFFKLDKVTIPDLVNFTYTVTEGYGRLRDTEGMDVRIGGHFPPSGGPRIPEHLQEIVDLANKGEDPWRVHYLYEHLHPFRDGNGRSGRVLWGWQMLTQDHYRGWGLDLGFLRAYYYQTLSQGRTGYASRPCCDD